MGVQYIVNARRPILAQRTVINFFKKSAIRDICNEENIPSRSVDSNNLCRWNAE